MERVMHVSAAGLQKLLGVTCYLFELFKADFLTVGRTTLSLRSVARLRPYRICDHVWMFRVFCMNVDCRAPASGPTSLNVAVISRARSLFLQHKNFYYVGVMFDCALLADSRKRGVSC